MTDFLVMLINDLSLFTKKFVKGKSRFNIHNIVAIIVFSFFFSILLSIILSFYKKFENIDSIEPIMNRSFLLCLLIGILFWGKYIFNKKIFLMDEFTIVCLALTYDIQLNDGNYWLKKFIPFIFIFIMFSFLVAPILEWLCPVPVDKTQENIYMTFYILICLLLTLIHSITSSKSLFRKYRKKTIFCAIAIIPLFTSLIINVKSINTFNDFILSWEFLSIFFTFFFALDRFHSNFVSMINEFKSSNYIKEEYGNEVWLK